MFKKLATLVCATAMACSAFTGVVVNAANQKNQGVNLVGEKIADNQITVSVYAVGFDIVSAADLNFSVTGATVDTVALDYAALSNTLPNVDSGIVYTTGSATSDVALGADGLILTLTLTFTENISQDVTISLYDECLVDDLEYYTDNDDEDNTLGFNDAVVEFATTPPHVDAAVADGGIVKVKDDVVGTYEHADQSAVIYGVKIDANDDTITGVTVKYDDEHQDHLTFNNTVVTGGSIVFAVVFANETGTWTGELPELTADMITIE